MNEILLLFKKKIKYVKNYKMKYVKYYFFYL